MKRFRFPLNTVMDYKQQVLDALTTEYGTITAQVLAQEAVVERCTLKYADTNEEFCAKKCTGITVAEAMTYQMGLQVLEREIEYEEERLKTLRAQAEHKRLQMVEAKRDTASLEMLKEKKLGDYNKAVLKSEEQFIDELVSASWSMEHSAAI